MKKISTALITTMLGIIIIVTTMMSVSSMVIVHKQVYEDTQTYLKTYVQQVANEVNTGFSINETITKTMGQQLRGMYDVTRLTDEDYNKEIVEKLNPLVLAVHEEYEELLSVILIINTNYTEGLYLSWSSDGELVDYTSPEDEAYIDDLATSLIDSVADGVAGWSDPYYDDVLGVNCMTYLVPIMIDGVHVGLAAIDINYDELIEPIKEVKLYETGSASLIDSYKYFIVDNEYTVEDKLTDVGYTDLEEAIDNEDESIIETTVNGTDYYMTYGTLTNGYNLSIKVPVSEVKYDIQKQVFVIVKSFIIIAVIIIILASLGVYLLSRRISLPISKVSEDLKEMSNNNWIGKEHESFKNYKNEIGILANSLDLVQVSMKETITTVSNSSNEINETVNGLGKAVSILGNKVTDIDEVAIGVSGSMEETASTAICLNEIANNMMIQVNNINQRNKDGLETVSIISEKAKDLNEKIEKDSANVREMSMLVDERLRETINGAQDVNKINQLVEAILGIAEQTGLLALNASIEAARSGEAGKGFAVVASEISELASSSKEVAEKIKGITSGVVDAVEKLCDTSNETLTFMETHLKEVNMKLMDTSKQYKTDTNDMGKLFNEMLELVEVVASDINNISKSSEELKIVTNVVAEGTSKIVNNISEITQVTEDVKTETENLSSVSEVLEEQVNKFIV